MAVPTLITDLSTVASSNFPAGPDSPALLDNVQRAHAAFIAQLRDKDTGVTPALGDNTTKLATTAFFQANSLGGAGQAWQTVIASRELGTTYTNTSGRPIEVIATVVMTSGITATIFANVNGVAPIYGSMTATISSGSSISIVVPPGATYSINYSSGPAVLGFWTELR